MLVCWIQRALDVQVAKKRGHNFLNQQTNNAIYIRFQVESSSAYCMCVSSYVLPEVHHHDTVCGMSQLLEGPVGEIEMVDVAIAPQLLCRHIILELYEK